MESMTGRLDRETGQRRLLDVSRWQRLTFDEQVAKIDEMWRRYMSDLVVIESDASQKVWTQHVGRNTSVPVMPHSAGGKRDFATGVPGLLILLENKKWEFPYARDGHNAENMDVFLSGDQAKEMRQRIKVAVEETAPWMTKPMLRENSQELVFRNGSRVSVAGAGKAVRGAHPDVIVGDDVLEEGNCMTALQRKRMERWWFGTIGGMTHPGTWRTLGQRKVWMPPSRVFLVGTPFHRQDLLMGMKDNPMYEFRRYAAEFGPDDLVDGLAVEVS